MSVFLKKVKHSSTAIFQVTGNAKLNGLPSSLSQSGRYVLLSDDVVYEILTAASNMAKNDIDRREALLALCFVCRLWSRAAQSLLFRHVFLQIRPPMLALLKIIDRKTERGKRLGASIRSATIKFSKCPESQDPPTLPMIHPRHLPALLCHMPNLCTLKLTMGGEQLRPDILTKLARGPRITALTLGHHLNAAENPVAHILTNECNPWPQLQSVTIEHSERPMGYVIPGGATGPRVRLSQIAINYPSGGQFDELGWLVAHSQETLTHVSLVCGAYDGSSNLLGHSHLKNIQSLTLGRTTWTDQLLHTINSFNSLRELRFVSFVQLAHPFPSSLPDTIEHLVVTAPFIPIVNPTSLGFPPTFQSPLPDMIRPALLKTFTALIVEWAHYDTQRQLVNLTGWNWAKDYARACEEHGISTELRKADRTMSGTWLGSSLTSVRLDGFDVPPRIRQSDGTFQPTASQLDLTKFEVIIGGKNVTEDTESSTREPALPIKTFNRSQQLLSGIQGLVSSWKGTRIISS